MKAIKSLMAAAALAAAGTASAATIGTFNVSSTALNPAIFNTLDENGDPLSLNLAITSSGYGTATLSDSGVLTLQMYTDQLIDYSPALLWGYPTYLHTFTDSTTVLKLTGTSYNFSINKSGSSITTTSCSTGPDDNLGSCGFLKLNTTEPLFGLPAYYSAQNFSIQSYSGNLGEVAGYGYIYNSFNIKSLAAGGTQIDTTYNLQACMDCAQPALVQFSAEVPVPASAWLFGSSLISLVGAARRRLA